ncbi:MAG: hypothetical protein J6Q84_01985 [Kiritimatiellae bacterium]|nr:hypothetical protein [Kiritimatiellia bacterium]
MQKFFSKYALAAHLALLAVAPLFLFPYFDSSVTAEVLLWMSLLTVLWLVLEPSKRVGEYLRQAQGRVLRSCVLDPLFGLFVLFFVIALIRCFNDGVQLVYDFLGDEWKWFITPSRVSWLPGSAGNAGSIELSTYIAVMVSVMACRHALGKSARIMFVFLSSLFAAIAAITAIWVLKGDAKLVADTTNYIPSSFSGSAFGVFSLSSIVSLAGMFERRWNKSLLLFAFAIGGAFSGLWYFGSSPIIGIYSVVGVLLILSSAINVAITNGLSAFFKFFVALIIASIIPIMVLRFLMPIEILDQKLAFLTFDFFDPQYYASRSEYVEIAKNVWQDGFMWQGGGLGCLPLYIQNCMAEKFWVKDIPCGWWQLIAERGFIGLAMYILPICFMLFTFALRLVKIRTLRAFWPMVILGLTVLLTVCVEGLFNAALLSPEVLVSTVAFLAVGVSSFSRRKVEGVENKE